MIFYFAHEGITHANEAESATHQNNNSGVLVFALTIAAVLLLAVIVRHLNSSKDTKEDEK
jgi:hypothetical protein